MGVHASVISLIAQVRRLGPFAEVKNVIELGDQQMGGRLNGYLDGQNNNDE